MDWDESLEGYEGLILVQAHCDARVLHDEICEYCSLFPEAQAKRRELGINFTGGRNDLLKPCPAERARGLVNISSWGGNHPKGPNVPQDYKEALRGLESFGSRVMYHFLDNQGE